MHFGNARNTNDFFCVRERGARERALVSEMGTEGTQGKGRPRDALK